MDSSSEDERRANRRFWLGVAGFFTLLALIVALGLVCAEDRPDDPSPNAKVETPRRA
jgi:hypothetical protein